MRTDIKIHQSVQIVDELMTHASVYTVDAIYDALRLQLDKENLHTQFLLVQDFPFPVTSRIGGCQRNDIFECVVSRGLFFLLLFWS